MLKRERERERAVRYAGILISNATFHCARDRCIPST